MRSFRMHIKTSPGSGGDVLIVWPLSLAFPFHYSKDMVSCSLTDLVPLVLFLSLMFTSAWPWLPHVFIAAHFTDMQNGERLTDDSQGKWRWDMHLDLTWAKHTNNSLCTCYTQTYIWIVSTFLDWVLQKHEKIMNKWFVKMCTPHTTASVSFIC